MNIPTYIRQRASSLVGDMRAGMSEKKFLALLAIFTGCLAGFGAAILKDFISYLSTAVKSLVPADHFNFVLLLLPVVGVLLCGIFSRYVVKDNMEYGCERIARALSSGNYRLPRHIAWAPIVACSLTLGFGGSAGGEGPIAYTGAGIGSNLGKFLGLPEDTLRTLVIIGSAAGIAGIFKAPVGGMMFALEVLYMPLTTMSMLALVFACLAAGCTAYAWSGFSIDVQYLPDNFFDPAVTAGVVLLGVFCGLYSLWYSWLMRVTEEWMRRISNPWVRNVVSGALIGLLIFLFPVLYGEGYGVVGDVVNGDVSGVLQDTVYLSVHTPWVLMVFVACTLLVKSMATGATNSGGGVGGDFAPTLFAGCLAGLLFASFSNAVMGTHLNVANFALFGMAAVMSGAIQAPLMAIFLTLEMVGDYTMFFPLTIAALFSYATVRILHRHFHVSFRPSWLHGLSHWLRVRI